MSQHWITCDGKATTTADSSGILRLCSKQASLQQTISMSTAAHSIHAQQYTQCCALSAAMLLLQVVLLHVQRTFACVSCNSRIQPRSLRITQLTRDTQSQALCCYQQPLGKYSCVRNSLIVLPWCACMHTCLHTHHMCHTPICIYPD